jgi:hypothetical protein
MPEARLGRDAGSGAARVREHRLFVVFCFFMTRASFVVSHALKSRLIHHAACPA